MRPPAAIKTWLDANELERWVRDAPTKESYRRRLAIWWTIHGRHAPEVADLLLTSPRTVRHWIRQFNESGPAALDSEAHGGRRAAMLSRDEEGALLAALHARAEAGLLVTIADVRSTARAHLGSEVSADYLYDLLHRYQWRKVQPRPRHVRADPNAQEAFKKSSQGS